MAKKSIYFGLIALLAFSIAAPPASAQVVRVSHLYYLSDFSGTVPYNGGRLILDDSTGEVYVAASNRVRVFNETGMETYSFGHDPELGLVRDLAIDEQGDILVLSQEIDFRQGSSFHVTRCDYRGIPKSPIELRGMTEYDTFLPDRLFYREGRIYLVSRAQKQVAIVDATTGQLLDGWDLAELIDLPDKERTSRGIVGFSVDAAGNMLFTIPVMFRAFVVSPDGDVASFGEPGATPGSFAVVAGIVSDGSNYFVVDKGRCVVMIFDDRFEFLSEFGYPGDEDGNLIRPNDLLVDGAGRIFVNQMQNRGVSAFSVSFR